MLHDNINCERSISNSHLMHNTFVYKIAFTYQSSMPQHRTL